MEAVLVVVPSPKSQNRLVMVPVEVSVKLTVSGFSPEVGLAVKFATGKSAPVPRTELVLLPSLPLVKTMTLLKLTGLVGVKRTTKLVLPNPGRLKGVPERIVKGPPFRLAAPFNKAAPPELVIVKFACTLVPTPIVPKLSIEGETDSCAGVRPEPVTEFVLLPPLLVNTTTLLKLRAFAGAKLTETSPVCPGARLRGVPL